MGRMIFISSIAKEVGGREGGREGGGIWKNVVVKKQKHTDLSKTTQKKRKNDNDIACLKSILTQTRLLRQKKQPEIN